MKKLSKWLTAGIVMIMCLGLTGCGQEFDAAGYTKAALDANYHGEYAEYAEFRQISEEDAKAEVEEVFIATVDASIEGLGFTEEQAENYKEALRGVINLAKYEVKEAEKQEDGSFVVTVELTPSDAYQTYQQHVEDLTVEKMNEGVDPVDPTVLAEILTEGLNRAVAGNTYGEPTTMEVKVTESGENQFGLEESEMTAIESALFPGV